LERSPLLRELAELGQSLLLGADWPTLEAYGALVEQERQARAPELPRLSFAPPLSRHKRARARPALDLRQLYDARIALDREVPCVSASYHDLLNVLAFAAFPRAKRALHARQYRALLNWLPPAGEPLPNRRTREQDALTLFDEGGSVLVTTPAAAARLRAQRQGTVDVSEQHDVRVVLFGHAITEHLSFHSSTVCSAAFLLCLEPPLPEGRALFERVDQALERRLTDGRQLLTPDFDRALSLEPPARVWA
jgi:hypothetical protein